RDALIARDELVGEEIVQVIHQALAQRAGYKPNGGPVAVGSDTLIVLPNGSEDPTLPEEAKDSPTTE
ncbi:MAG TPA: hypothetical protein VGR13_06260, partial [Actinomycetota bacterium]|nr:hypothetical protein [Actinomycetota bacterium]